MNYKELAKDIQIILHENIQNGIQEIVELLQQRINHYSWVGIYVIKGDMLHLGPWAGEHATEHVEIPIGRGICGSAAKTGKIEIVSNVHADKRYLSCFISTKSEIVIPIKYENIVVGEIDIDSDEEDAFTKKDALFLENIADILGQHIHKLL